VVPPSRAAVVAWLDAIADAIRAVDATHPLTLGLHMEDLEEDRRLGPGDESYTHPQAHLRRLYQRFRMYCSEEECGERQRDQI
jgi:hypothetical protein